MTGASWHKGNKNWQSLITFQGKKYYCGSFTTELKAHEAYKLKKKELILELWKKMN